LRSAGIDAELVFGMGRADTADGYDGHCWVTVDGAPYLEPRDPRDAYVAMYTLGKSTLARRAERATSAEA
jgi:transglutaminase-like putative cysteine protease